ncbi:MAG: glycosyltransferase family 39 protein [Elusimicrobia bacterium]|nr:glycosyltransferase family 39 protein [Elusimicrobiota bacterium]
MRKKAEALSPWAWVLLACALLAAALRFVKIGYGLPHTYNADEPHLINMAVSFGSGSLRPHSFKYPTVWPTLLAGLYGLWYGVWSVMGLRKSPADFAALYGFAPTGFYLIARLAAAAASLGALAVVSRTERAEDRARWPYGALMLAFSPVLVELAHAAKPDSLMLLFVAGAWACALRFQAGGARGWLLAAGALTGAACSTQYTAAPLTLLLPLAWLLREGGPSSWTWLVQAAAFAAAAFVAGSPFIALDFRRFAADWTDYADLGRLRPHDAAAMARAVAYNLWTYGGDGSPAGAAAVLGLGVLAWRRTRRALLLLAPVAAYAVVLSGSPDGGWQRYLLGVFPALALLSSEGLVLLGGKSPWRRAAVAALVLAPGLFLSWRYVADLTLPDTRAQAEAWMTANIPEGETVLLDLPHASPRAIASKEQCADLAARTAAARSPRSRLWRAMADRHPGGGWRVYRIQRSAGDLFSAPRHVAASQADGDFLDVRPGLDPVRAVRARWVVTSSFGADPRRARELSTFFAELAAGADLVHEFPSEPGSTMGPWLRVWRLRR